MLCPYCHKRMRVSFGYDKTVKDLPRYVRRQRCRSCKVIFTTEEHILSVDPERVLREEPQSTGRGELFNKNDYLLKTSST